LGIARRKKHQSIIVSYLQSLGAIDDDMEDLELI